MVRDYSTLFVDLLGFADLVEADHEAGVDHRNVAQFMANDFHAARALPEIESPLVKALVAFNLVIRRQPRVSCAVSTLVFSDCAFLVFERPLEAVGAAVDMMVELASHSVPVRMGLACGTFTAANFGIGAVAGNVGLVSSLFWGTGIVRAHRAESCGHSGMRILVDPSFDVSGSFGPYRLVEIPASDKPLRRAVRLEVSYLTSGQSGYKVSHYPEIAAKLRADDSQFIPGHRYPELGSESRGSSFWNTWYFLNLQRMARNVPEAERRHYYATLEALERMEAANQQARD